MMECLRLLNSQGEWKIDTDFQGTSKKIKKSKYKEHRNDELIKYKAGLIFTYIKQMIKVNLWQ